MASRPDSILRTLVISNTPYPDPIRRRRIRAQARELVRCDPWPGNEATPSQVAQLSLLRAMWLQRETRRAARSRQREAIALLTRASVENCIVGLYCLHTVDPVDQLRGDNATSVRRLFGYLTDSGAVTSSLIDIVHDSVGGTGQLPSVKDMAEAVARVTGEATANDLYKRLYIPLSTFFAHANASALLRHVKSDDSLQDVPMFPWTIRSAVRTSDACVGIIAAAVGRTSGMPVEHFVEYAKAHMRRSMAPLATFVGRNLRHSVDWKLLPSALRVVIASRTYFNSADFATDSWEVRKQKLRNALEKPLGVLRVDMPEELRQRFIDEWVTTLVGPPPMNEPVAGLADWLSTADTSHPLLQSGIPSGFLDPLDEIVRALRSGWRESATRFWQYAR
jgi:hypothetical protein